MKIDHLKIEINGLTVAEMDEDGLKAYAAQMALGGSEILRWHIRALKPDEVVTVTVHKKEKRKRAG